MTDWEESMKSFMSRFDVKEKVDPEEKRLDLVADIMAIYQDNERINDHVTWI